MVHGGIALYAASLGIRDNHMLFDSFVDYSFI